MVVLKRIHIKNFRSIVDATIELDDFNFFVGKNDSGKSNVLKAINLFLMRERIMIHRLILRWIIRNLQRGRFTKRRRL